MKRDLDFIVAMTEDRVIGRDNQLPWRLPEDLKRFKAITMGHSIVMGRKTYESIGKPLPGRANLVLTRSAEFEAPGTTVCHSWAEVSDKIVGKAFVIGGADIFAQALPRLHRLYLTVVFEKIDGDAFFPELDLKTGFTLEEQSEVFEQPLKYQFQNWVQKA